MKLSENKQIKIPNTLNEELKKVDIERFFTSEYKTIKNLNIPFATIEKGTLNSLSLELFDILYDLQTEEFTIKVQKSTKEPIILIYDLKDFDTLYTHALKFEISEDIEVCIIEVYKNISSSNSHLISNKTFNLGKNSSLHYSKINDLQNLNSSLHNIYIKQKENSKLEISNIQVNETFNINNYVNILDEQNCEYKLNSLVKISKQSQTTNLVKTIHNEKNSLSDINFKHILNDKARAVFKAKSIVNNEALFTKAFQNSNTILLSDDAVIFAQPHLEILVDELEASHGATTGSLDKNQLLYLQTRGISKDLATKMLLKAYERQIYDNISHKDIKKYIENYLGLNDV